MPNADDQPMSFGKLLRNKRGARTLREVATAVEAGGQSITTQNLSNWERDRNLPKSPAVVRAVERVLGCEGDLTAALGWDEEVSRLDVLEARLGALERSQKSLQRDLRAALRELRAGS